MKRDNEEEILTDLTDVVKTDTHMGLDADTITTYWLSYDRDNMTVKYGKGYAMEETTLLICDFFEGATNADKLAKKRRQWSIFFGMFDQNRRKEGTILLYRTPSDIKNQEEQVIKSGEVAAYVHMESLIEITKQPLVANPSPFE